MPISESTAVKDLILQADSSAHDHSGRVLRIEPSRGWVALKLRELWEYRELLYFLVWRDVRVRYKQTALGAAWAVMQPLFMMLVFGVFFGRLAKVPSDGVPYPIFSYTGLLPWTFFVHGLTQGSDSLVGSANLIRKVYFPRLTIPMATVLAGLVDFAIAFVILLVMMGFYRVWPSPVHLLWLFPLLLLALVTSLGVGFWLSALNVKFRDVKYMLPFISQLWFYATPIVYPSSLLSEPWRTIYGLNPMAGVVEGFRWVLLNRTPPGPMIFVSASVALAVLIGGAFYFRRMEKTFADTV